VKSKAQKIFGYGDNPNFFVDNWYGGRYADEVLTDADLVADITAAALPVAPTPGQGMAVASSTCPLSQTTRPGDDFNERGRDEFRRILERHGWNCVREDNSNEYWVRPGKDPKTGHHSATLHRYEPLFYVFSSNAAPFEGNKAYTYFDAYALLEHGGDHSAAAKELARLGYGASASVTIAATSANNSVPPIQWQPFPLETLSWNLRCFVEDVSALVGLDSAHAALSVLSILSGCMGRTFVAELKPGYQEHPAIWAGVVAPAGMGKTPPMQKATRPLFSMEQEMQKQYVADVAKYKKDLATYNQSLKSASPPTTPPPTEPIRIRFVVGNPTVEKLLPLLAQNPFGLCLYRDELAGWLGSLDMYKKSEGDLQTYLEIHGGLAALVDRVSSGSLFAATPSLSILGGIQTERFRAMVKKNPDFLATGLMARFLLILPPPQPVFWNYNTVAPWVLDAYDRLIRRIVECRQQYTPDNPGVVHLTAKSREMIFAFQNQAAAEIAFTENDGVRTLLAKAGMHCARLALTLHVAKALELDTFANSYPDRQLLDEEMMEQAITLTKWFLNEGKRVYAMLGRESDDMDGEAMQILAYIRRLGENATARNLRSSIDRYKREGGTDRLKSKLRCMVEAGIVSVRTEKRGNQPVDIYYISTLPVSAPSTPSAGGEDEDAEGAEVAEGGEYVEIPPHIP